MEVLVRLVKAVGIALVVITLFIFCFLVLVWTKGLFFMVFVFGVLVYVIYQRLAWRARTMRRRDAGWLA